MNTAPTPLETAAELRREFPTTLLSWGDALRLLVRLGLGKYDMEQWCQENPDGFRRLVGKRKRHLYNREFILQRALAGSDE